MDTRELSHCCGVYVYSEFSGHERVSMWEEMGLIPGKDFKPLAEVECCSACLKPCQVVVEIKDVTDVTKS